MSMRVPPILGPSLCLSLWLGYGAVAHAAVPEQLQSAPASASQTVWVKTQEGELQALAVKPIAGHRVFEGDVLVDRLPGANPVRSLSVASMGRLWPDALVPYEVAPELGSYLHGVISSAIAHWEQKTRMRFVERTGANAASYPDYVRFTPSSAGCASYIGRRGGLQEVYLNGGCSIGNMIHEIGHAVGLYHEHTRPDRDQYVAIMSQNIEADRLENFYTRPANSVRMLGTYDYDSIMHYGAYFFSTNGQPTVVPHDGNLSRIGQRNALSSGDINAVNSLYSVDMSLTLQSDDTLVEPNASAHFELYISNHSHRSSEPLSLTLSYPEGVEFQQSDAASAGWQCQNSAPTLSCQRGAVGGNVVHHFSASFQMPAVGNPLRFEARLDSGASDANSSNNQDSLDVVVNSENFAPSVDAGQAFALSVQAEAQALIGTVRARDDNRDPLSYRLQSGTHSALFQLNPKNGELRLATGADLNGLLNRTLNLGIQVNDGQLDSPVTAVKVQVTALPVAQGGALSAPESGSGGGGGAALVLGAGLLFWRPRGKA